MDFLALTIKSVAAATKNIGRITADGNSGIVGEEEGLGLGEADALGLGEGVGDGAVVTPLTVIVSTKKSVAPPAW